MNGTAHMLIGAGVGFVAANSYQTDPTTTLLFVGVGAVSGLMPDIDIDGKLTNRITFSHKMIQYIAQLIGFLMMIYSYIEGSGKEKWVGIAVGIAILFISTKITQRRMLTVTGVGVLIGGISLQEPWLLLLGVFIMIASFVPHRSYTHSLLGLILFGVIAHLFEQSIGIEGVYKVAVAAYASHLIADMKFLPFNRRGVKLFLPLTSKEI
ncbi:metal-dependent hydrolase [Mesobacillus maritimus]|uniref:Metal-dependent hydrolase n=1 Tax=Mesobacillus maritimus TaxID=1643336 RepID=A0ABS7KBG9_9BACI|nr:metal-dependent hydrolase [Mesobacillus maritimus]MBY0099602.1 metal-dependent hydrolase [Mesobacillus maritimus]